MTRVGGEGVDEIAFDFFFFFSGLGHRADGNVLSGLGSSEGRGGEGVS